VWSSKNLCRGSAGYVRKGKRKRTFLFKREGKQPIERGFPGRGFQSVSKEREKDYPNRLMTYLSLIAKGMHTCLKGKGKRRRYILGCPGENNAYVSTGGMVETVI